MSSDRSDLPFLCTHLLVMVELAPIFFCTGLGFAVMGAVGGLALDFALLVGLAGGAWMWLTLGSVLAGSIAWRPSAALPAVSRQALRLALQRACTRFPRLALIESPDHVLLVAKRIRHALLLPRKVLAQIHNVRIDWLDDTPTLTAPALVFWDFKWEMVRLLSEANNLSEPEA
jgi:hypothetical protein